MIKMEDEQQMKPKTNVIYFCQGCGSLYHAQSPNQTLCNKCLKEVNGFKNDTRAKKNKS